MLKMKDYDVVVFGDSLCGILSAAILRDHGTKVLLLVDQEISVRREKGYLIDEQMLPLGNIPDTPSVTNILGRAIKYKEIAEILGKSESSCKMSFSRTIKDLRENSQLLHLLLSLIILRTVI